MLMATGLLVPPGGRRGMEAHSIAPLAATVLMHMYSSWGKKSTSDSDRLAIRYEEDTERTE